MRNFIIKGLAGFLVLQFAFPALSHAVQPPLKDRAFYRQKEKLAGGENLPLPWVDIAALHIPPENKHAVELRKWLLEHQATMQTWPPGYTDDDDAVALIKAWQKKRRNVEKWQPSLAVSPELASLAVTFWVYGHNLDEPEAADRAYALIDELIGKFKDHPLPLMMKGMLLSRTGGEGVTDFLSAARSKTGDKARLGLIDMAMTAQCTIAFKLHRSLVALSEALDECPDCVRQYWGNAILAVRAGTADPRQELGNPYYLFEGGESNIIGSRFYGFKVKLSSEWMFDRYLPYDPEKRIGVVMFNAEPLRDSGLIHNVMFYTALTSEQGDEPVHFLETFAGPSSGVKRTAIKPLVKSRYLTHWYKLETTDPVGENDTITMISASGTLRPETWTLSEHRKLMQEEGPCEISSLKPEKLSIRRSAGRVAAPVEFTVNYSASKGSYAEAEKKMKEIVSTLELETHAFSEVVEKLDRAAK